MQDDKALVFLALAATAALVGGAVASGTMIQVGATDADSEAQTTALLRTIHAAPGVGQVDVLVDGREVTSNLSYTEAAPYQSVESGTVNVSVVASDTGEVFFNGSVRLEADTRYSILGALAVDENGTASFQPSVLTDDYTVPSLADSTVRFVHAVPDLGAVDVTVVGPSGNVTTVAENVSFGEAAGYVTVPEGDYTVQLREASGNATDDDTDDAITTTTTTTEAGANETTATMTTEAGATETTTAGEETTTAAGANETTTATMTTAAGANTTTTTTDEEPTEPGAPDGAVLLELNVTFEGGAVYSALGAGFVNDTAVVDGDDGPAPNETTTTTTMTTTAGEETTTTSGANETTTSEMTTTAAGVNETTPTMTTTAGEGTTTETEANETDEVSPPVDTSVQVVLIVDARRPDVQVPIDAPGETTTASGNATTAAPPGTETTSVPPGNETTAAPTATEANTSISVRVGAR